MLDAISEGDSMRWRKGLVRGKWAFKNSI